MKKILKAALILTSAALITAPLASCGEKPVDPPTPPVVVVDVTSLEVSSAQINLHPGETKKLEVTVLPENASNKGLKFTSTDSSIATVNEEGVIKAVADGTAVVVVSSVSNPSISKQVIVNVKTAHVSVTEILVSEATLDLKEGESKDLVVTVLPENATNKALTFSSTNQLVATVSKEGKVAAVSSGTAVINIFSVDNPAAFKQVTVNVKKDHIDVTKVEVSEKEMAIQVGESVTVPVTVSPEDASNKALTWESSASNIISVDQTGKIKGETAGSATITVKSVDNPAAYAIITVTAKENVKRVNSVALDKTTLEIVENGEAQKLTPIFDPTDADNKAVQWTSSNPQVASVSADGYVTPIKKGTATITVTTVDGGKTATCDVTITKVELESITLDQDKISFSVAATGADAQKQLNYTLNPEHPTYEDVTWMSTNEAVATVTSTGLVEMVGEGTCAIVVTHVNSGKTASCAVSVNKVEATNIALNITEIYFTLNTGDATKQLEVSFEPGNVTHQEVTWISSDSSVASVTNTGLVSRVGKGEATITVRHNDSGLTATCDVYVTEDSVFRVRGCEEAENWQTYTRNKGAKENPLAEFVTKDLPYKVGDDNKISFKPVLHVFKGKQEVDPSNYTGGYSIKVEKKVNASYIDAPTTEFASFEADASIDFDATAIGNTYKLTICPKEIEEEFIEDFTHVYLVDVVDGYNVTNVDEISMFETTGVKGWDAFKSAKGIDASAHPTTYVIHKDLKIEQSSLPGYFFYTSEEGASWSKTEQDKSVGSLKDYEYLYEQTINQNTTFFGNYFSIDWSTMPLVTRPGGNEETPDNKLNSHSCLFRTTAGSMTFKDISLIGNSHVAKTDADIKFDGGLIGFKLACRTDYGMFDNILEHGCYIGVMSEGSDGVKDPAEVTVKDAKFYDNNNSFLYNWGGHMNLKNSLFEGCGGPVIIQDQTGVNTDVPSEHYYDYLDNENPLLATKFLIHGYSPKTVFEDCTINNYVLGQESWFKSFGATELAPMITGLSATLLNVDGASAKTFVFDNKHVGMNILNPTEQPVFNFIVLNKSGCVEGLPNEHVNGEVLFISNGVVSDKFDYFRPVDKQESEPDNSRFLSEYQFNQQFRGIQKQAAPGMPLTGAPIFETYSGSYAVYEITSGAVSTIPALASGTPAAPETTVCSQAHDHIALYYGGNMLVFELGTIGK